VQQLVATIDDDRSLPTTIQVVKAKGKRVGWLHRQSGRPAARRQSLTPNRKSDGSSHRRRAWPPASRRRHARRRNGGLTCTQGACPGLERIRQDLSQLRV